MTVKRKVRHVVSRLCRVDGMFSKFHAFWKLNCKPLHPRTFHLTYPTHIYQLYAMTGAFLWRVQLHTDPTGAR